MPKHHTATKQEPIEVFMPPNILKAKVGGGTGLDPTAIRRAEQAIEELKEEFDDWLADDVERLAVARDMFERVKILTSFDALYRASHDLRGQGATYDYPLVARVASSLCTLADAGGGNGTGIPMALIDAHVDAIKVIVRDKIKDPSDRTATLLASELESKVLAFLEKRSARV